MDELHIENVYTHTATSRGADSSLQMLEFFKKHFAMKPGG
jgi:hypothetical protein